MKVKGLAAAVGAFLVAFGLSASAHAQVPGQVLYTYYETTEPFTVCGTSTADSDGCNVGGNGDNIIRLINPNGSANPGIGGLQQPVCAMIYVFDDDEEMGECCGCPLTSAQLATFSVEDNLTSNWGLRGGIEGGDHANGAIAIVAAAQNVPVSFVRGLSNGQGCANGDFACNRGCDPTNTPGYSVATANNLVGSITHNQIVAGNPNVIQVRNITETALSDDCHGEAINLTYLQSQCGALVGNGTLGGICNCPIE